ncbi:calcium-binding protein [Paracoccus yeei]|uniref:calcium-binding protein n=1 Tax=Paracoccus yeei TaxID=147645 RepID=UPI000AF93E36|nr:calcium-binding protein [Paracoccus yeei]
MQSSANHVLGANLENLVLTGAAAINGTGNALANSITGNAAANVLNGGAGADTLIGGAGNDTYVTDGFDTITEAAGAGVDVVQSAGGYTLAANLENLVLTGTAINGVGNNLGNRLTGNASNNVLSGGGGDDTLIGGAGNDTLNGGAGLNTVIYTGAAAVAVNLLNGTASGGQGSDTLTNIGVVLTGAGNDALVGDSSANALNGGAGNDTISGGGGADFIAGEAGTDLMRGGAGDGLRDTFVFYAHTDSAVGAARDIIENFVSGIDRLDLADIDANAAVAGAQGFLFSGTTARANAVWYAATADGIVVRADINGNTGADFEVLLRGVTSLTGNDFLL